ncbi:SREBP cleavage activating protein isoform X2 [Arctopsyche grandis]|uniref:SREBP cleavage activating protein isoform X2 n=1 Tax=Arctopsyche grandis TaxID=121162 RepID=UPI00406D6DAF
MATPDLPKRISQYYYSHGLFCSSHPIASICIAIICFVFCCIPLMNIPLPGSIPHKSYLPYKYADTHNTLNDATNLFVQLNASVSNDQAKNRTENLMENISNNDANATINLSSLMNETVSLPYLWAKEEPLLYVQQIIFKTGVWPWRDELKSSDAFRAPLQEVFRLVEVIRNHQDQETETSLGHVCFHVENVKRDIAAHKSTSVLPEYSCLLLSPANLWQQNVHRFVSDANIVSTVFSYQNSLKSKVSLAEMVFGMHIKETGIKRYPLRARPRALQYAVTIFFHRLNDNYINSLKEKLSNAYPLHHKWDSNQTTNQIMLIYYPGEFNYREFVPLCLTFVGLFVYIYFSVRKLEFVRSKLGLAVSAVASVAASLTMTIGICFFFGITLSFQGKEIFPYLVILVGVENVFVLTKSVMSIDSKLDVKMRLAQGLSKEGWSITKNLLIEITILTISLFTFVPVIQQFSIFMIVSLLSDFFLQMVFFTTVLGIDIRRKEALRENTSEFQLNRHMNQGKLFIQNFTGFSKIDFEGNLNSGHNFYSSSSKIIRSKSHPKLNGLTYQPHTNVVANLHQNSTSLMVKTDEKKIPKRIRLVKIWARTRFFQRAFMVWMIVWISMIIYNSGIIENIFDITDMGNHDAKVEYNNNVSYNMSNKTVTIEEKSKLGDFVSIPKENQQKSNQSIELNVEHISKGGSSLNVETNFDKLDLENLELNPKMLNKTLLQHISLKHMTYPQPWLRLSEFHWSSILSQYNVSCAGRYLAVLPPILIKHRVSPERAIAARNPAEKDSIAPSSRWRALVAALDPLDLTDFEIGHGIPIPALQLQTNWGIPQSPNEIPYYPSSPMEILLLAILCLISVLVIAYTMVVLYGCVCTKNYAEWRTSWRTLEKENQSTRPALQFVMEAVPIVVSGHAQEIECLATNGESIVSSCLQGQLKMWNPSNGELIANFSRNNIYLYKYGLQKNSHRLHHKDTPTFELHSSDESDSTPPRKFSSCVEDSSISNTTNFCSNTSFTSIESDYLSQENDLINLYNKSSALRPHINEENCSSDLQLQEKPSLMLNKSHLKRDILKSYHLSQEKTPSQSIGESTYCEKFNQTPPGDSKSHEKPIFNIINDKNCPPSIWCMDFADDLIVLGCSDGRLEFWEASTAKFHCIFDDGLGNSVSNVKLLEEVSCRDMHVVVARLTGHLDLLLLECPPSTQQPHKKTHVRSGSAGSILLREKSTHHRFGHEHDPLNMPGDDAPPFEFLFQSNDIEENIKSNCVQCRRLTIARAHQQPITILECDGRRILTGSQDHTLKVFSAYDLSGLYTLHGHCGPITCAFIDRFWHISGSGSEDGLLCVWDLMSGACLYSIQAHDGPISGLVYSESYVISLGTDERLCIWDRFRGHLLNSMNIGHGAGNCGMLTLTHSLVITGGRGGLIVWDASTGEAVRKVVLGPSDGYVFVRQILPLKDAIVCDYANELRIIRFPIVSRIDRQFERKNN